jgi:heme a synthase
LHRFSVFVACFTLLLIVAGALVTSNDAGLSVPDWPTSFGSIYKIPHMVGGVKYEHTHRMVAESVGLLTIILCVWLWRADRRRWMKYLGAAALLMVIIQGVLGGITVLYYLPPLVSSTHAAVAQTFFCTVIAIAIFTGRDWIEEAPQRQHDPRRPSLFALCLLSVAILYLQLFLGAMFRHHGMSWWPHVLDAPIVAGILAWTVFRALVRHSAVAPIRRAAGWVLGLLLTQIFLGFLAFELRVVWGHNAVQPELPMVISTVAHVAVGALLLGATVVLTIQAWRHLSSTAAMHVPPQERKTVAA